MMPFRLFENGQKKFTAPSFPIARIGNGNIYLNSDCIERFDLKGVKRLRLFYNEEERLIGFESIAHNRISNTEGTVVLSQGHLFAIKAFCKFFGLSLAEIEGTYYIKKKHDSALIMIELKNKKNSYCNEEEE